MALHYDHPILLVRHMLWHKGDPQTKLALKVADPAISGEGVAPVRWELGCRRSERRT
jgi:hypothetical protein